MDIPNGDGMRGGDRRIESFVELMVRGLSSPRENSSRLDHFQQRYRTRSANPIAEHILWNLLNQENAQQTIIPAEALSAFVLCGGVACGSAGWSLSR